MDAFAALRIADDAPVGAFVAPTGVVRPASALELQPGATITSAVDAVDESGNDDSSLALGPDKAKKKKKKKSKTASKLGGDHELAFLSASNAFDHTKDQDMEGLIKGLDMTMIMALLQLRERQPAIDAALRYIAESEALREKAQGAPPEAPEVLEWHALRQKFKNGNATTEDNIRIIAFTSKLAPPYHGNLLISLEFGGRPDTDDSPTLIFCSTLQRNFLHGHPLFKKQLLIEPHLTKVPFRIVDIPGRGKGLVATRPIARDTVFFREPPLLIAPSESVPEFFAQFDSCLEEAMYPRTRGAFDDLHSCRSQSRLDKLRTNGFMVTLYPPSDNPHFITYSGVFQVMSRANHSCAPNVFFTWSYVNFQGGFKTLRDIAAGEEITTSYLGNGPDFWLPTALRRKKLEDMYLFTCTCSRCGPA